MKRASLLLLGASVVLGGLLPSSAAAVFNVPKQARKQSVEFVPAFNQCVAPSLTHRPNLANPACPPAQSSANNPANTFTFGPKGGLSVMFTTIPGNAKVAWKGSEILVNGSPYSGTGLVASTVYRVTDNGCGSAPEVYDIDCTMVDIPWPMGLSCSNGNCSGAKTTINALYPGALHFFDRTSIQIGSLAVIDPDGDEFARGGIFVP